VRAALAFLTPFPGARRPSARALPWFPVVGAALGLALGGLWWATDRLWPLPIAALITVAADLALTGLLHLDGLADAADGLLPHLTRARRLEVMREPTVGAFGVGAVVTTVLARWVVLATLRPAPLLIAALWCASRTSMAGVVERVPYARALDGPDGPDGESGGLVSAFMGARLPLLLAVPALAGAAALAAIWSVPAGPVAVGAAVLTFGAVLAFAHRRLGGFTGDVLGAAGILAETVGLLVAAARW
jgi:adenosylcobinamide-GDP ribazoletransferase